MSEALTQRVKELEAELEKLKSQLEKSSNDADLMSDPSPSPAESNCASNGNVITRGRNAGKKRHFDFSAHPRRHVALRLAYLGWVYQGFAVQENTDKTVEARLFEALQKTCLIQDRQSSNYHRCGRTDKGVSAFSQVTMVQSLNWPSFLFLCNCVCVNLNVCSLQVITIDLRSTQFCGGLGVRLPENIDAGQKGKTSVSELPYVKMLNRVLPHDIRILDWAPAAEGFSARFDCQSRTYRYYFPRGPLNVDLMADAAKRWRKHRVADANITS